MVRLHHGDARKLRQEQREALRPGAPEPLSRVPEIELGCKGTGKQGLRKQLDQNHNQQRRHDYA